MLTPHVRQVLYSLSTVVSGVITLLTAFNVLTPTVAVGAGKIIEILVGLLATGASGTAAVVLNKQRKDATLDFQGTPAEQAVAAIQATVAQAASAADDLNKVRDAVSNVLADAAALPGSLVDQLLQAVNTPRK